MYEYIHPWIIFVVSGEKAVTWSWLYAYIKHIYTCTYMQPYFIMYECICAYIDMFICMHITNFMWQLFLQKRQRWFMDVYIHTYIGIIIIIIICKHIIIHVSFIYNTIPLNVLYSSSNSSSFWTNFEQICVNFSCNIYYF